MINKYNRLTPEQQKVLLEHSSGKLIESIKVISKFGLYNDKELDSPESLAENIIEFWELLGLNKEDLIK